MLRGASQAGSGRARRQLRLQRPVLVLQDHLGADARVHVDHDRCTEVHARAGYARASTRSIDFNSTVADLIYNTAEQRSHRSSVARRFFLRPLLRLWKTLSPWWASAATPSRSHGTIKAYGSRALSIALDTPRLGINDDAMLVLSRRASENS